jgi:hypothetical protein
MKRFLAQEQASISSEGREYSSQKRQDLAQGLRWLWESGRYLDTELVAADGDPIRVHGVVLAACSEPFKAMLSGGYTETVERRIVLPIHRHRVVKRMVQFMYTGEIEIADDMVMDLFSLADEFQMIELKRVCEEHVATGISVKSVLPLLSAAKNHTAEQLYQKCLEFFKNHAVDVLQLESWVSVDEDIVIDLLQMDFRIQEIKVFQAVVKWGEYRVKQSNGKLKLKDAVANIIKFVRFISIKKDYLKKTVFSMDILPKEILIDVLMERIKDPKVMVDEDDDEKSDQLNLTYKPWMKSRGRMFKVFADFASENEYAEYLKSMIRPGTLLRAMRTYENVLEGDIGAFIQYNSGIPPCQVNWRGFGNPYWLYWRDVEIVEDELAQNS